MKFEIKEITINGNKYPVLCDINAIEMIQNRWGLSTLKAGVQKHDEYNITELSALVHVLTTEACEVSGVDPVEIDQIKYDIIGEDHWEDVFMQVVDTINTSLASAKNRKTATTTKRTTKKTVTTE